MSHTLEVWQKLSAIDIHTHAEVSCQHRDPEQIAFDEAASKYFGIAPDRPSIQDTIQLYRELNIGLVMFTVDSEAATGIRRIPNEEIAQAAQDNADMMMAFASIDPYKGKKGAKEARALVESWGVKGFKLHPPLQGFHPADPIAWPLYEVINEHQLPVIFHTGYSGMGTGMRAGGGVRLKFGQPILVDDVAVDFPDMKIILAHPSWPWTDESLAMALHKPNVYIDLSGWRPKYFPPQIAKYANAQLSKKMLFGSDFPLIRPDRWIDDFQAAGFKESVHQDILKNNALHILFEAQ